MDITRHKLRTHEDPTNSFLFPSCKMLHKALKLKYNRKIKKRIRLRCSRGFTTIILRSLGGFHKLKLTTFWSSPTFATHSFINKIPTGLLVFLFGV